MVSSCSQTVKCLFSLDTCYMCTAYISIQSDCVFIVRAARRTGAVSLVNIINHLWKVIVHHAQRRLSGHKLTRSVLGLSPSSDRWSHLSSTRPPERLEFSSALPFLFAGVYLLCSNSFPAPLYWPPCDSSGLVILRDAVRAVHFLNVRFDRLNESVGVRNESDTLSCFSLIDLAFYDLIIHTYKNCNVPVDAHRNQQFWPQMLLLLSQCCISCSLKKEPLFFELHPKTRCFCRSCTKVKCRKSIWALISVWCLFFTNKNTIIEQTFGFFLFFPCLFLSACSHNEWWLFPQSFTKLQFCLHGGFRTGSGVAWCCAAALLRVCLT